MKYREYPMCYDLIKRNFGKEAPSITQYTASMIAKARLIKSPVTENQGVIEHRWDSIGRPYYKVDDAACQMFRGVNIDVPFKYVKFPFDVFSIRFSESCPLKTKFGPVRSMLVSKAKPDRDHGWMFSVWVDCGEILPDDDYNIPIIDFIAMHSCDDVPVEYSLNQLALRCEGNELYAHGLQRDVIAIAVSVCFLATSEDKMVRPDVLGKDFAAYLEAARRNDEERMRVITERGKRRGKIGFIVDGERELIHHPQDHYDSEPTGRELSHRHVRSAHFRKLSTGLVTWVRQHVVRPDLPARSIA